MTAVDERMIELIERLITAGTIKTRQQFLDAIGMLKQDYRNVTIGRRSFRIEHITAACKEYGVNANWIHGLEDKIFSRCKGLIQTLT
jgi:chorismate mutase